MGPRKCSNFRTALFICLMHTFVLFCSYTNITSSNMASKAIRDLCVALQAAGTCNRDITKQLNVCRETVFNVWTDIQRLMQSPASTFLVESVQFVLNQSCSRLWGEWSEILAGTWEKRLVSSEFQNHLCTEYFKIIWDFLHLKRNPDTYFPQLPGKNGKTDSKGCWRICNAPSVMSPLEHLHIRVSYQHAEWW